MQTPEGLQNAVTLVLENMAQDGVIYAELRFAPQFHTLGGMTQEQAVQAAVAGLKNAPIPGNLILCCMRGEGNEKANEETLALTKKYLVKDHGVTAMDLAGGIVSDCELSWLVRRSESGRNSVYRACRGGRWAGECTRGDSDWNKTYWPWRSQHGG